MKYKVLNVAISVTMSSNQYIEVPENFDETNLDALKEVVKDQIFLPQDMLEFDNYNKQWNIDDFCVMNNEESV